MGNGAGRQTFFLLTIIIRPYNSSTPRTSLKHSKDMIESLVAYNATLPISRILVPELFSEIIHFALQEDPPRPISDSASGGVSPMSNVDDPRQRKRHLGAAVAASHVCFAWRTLCIGTPTLWARQIGMIPSAISVFLDRSGRALLEITASDFRANYWKSTPCIDSSRIRSMKWSEDQNSSGVPPLLCKMLQGNLSNLDDLCLRVESAIDRECLEDIGSLGDTPRLTRLWFSGVYIPFIAPCLTCLSLQSVTVALSQLIVALRSVPLLEAFEFLESELPVDLSCNLESMYPSRPDPVKLPRLNHLHLDNGDESANIEDGLHSLLDNLCIRPQSMGVMLAWGVPFPLFVISLRTGFKYKPLTFLRLEGYWDMWVLKPRVSHLPPIYPSVSDVQIGFIDAELSARGNYGPLLRGLDLQELRCITEIELCVHIVGMWLSGIHPLLYALPNVTACWISQGKEDVMDYYTNCVELLSYLSSECEGSLNNAASASSVHIQYPFPRLRILGIEGIELTSDDVLVQLLQTLTFRSERDYPILHMLSLPDFCRPKECGLNNMSGVAANIECLTETVHWGRGSDEGSDDDSDGTSGTDDRLSEERNGDEDEGC